MLKKYLLQDLTTFIIIFFSMLLIVFSYCNLMLVVCSIMVSLIFSIFVLIQSIKERLIYKYNLLLAIILPISIISFIIYMVNFIFHPELLNTSDNIVSLIMFFVSAWSIFTNFFVLIGQGRKESHKNLIDNIHDVDDMPYEYCTTNFDSRIIFFKYHLTFEINHVVWNRVGYRVDIVRKYMNENNLNWKDMKDEDFQMIEMLII